MPGENHRIKLFINTSTVLISGGLILSLDIIESLQQDGEFDIVFTCPKLKPYSQFQNKNSRLVLVPRWMLYKIMRWYHDYFWLTKLIKKENPDLVLTLCNLPAVTKYRQIFLHDNPYVTEKNLKSIPLSFSKKVVHWLRSALTISRLKYVDLLIVQTEYQRKNIIQKIRKNLSVIVVPPCIPRPKDFHLDSEKIGLLSDKDYYKVLCPTRYYEHKNLEILLHIAKLIKQQQLPIRIYLTISPKHGKKAKQLLEEINEKHIEEILINIGQVSHRSISEFIKKADAILLPSILESFSLTCIEAWHYERPLLVSDLDTLKSACGDAAYYFNPFSPEDILNVIKTISIQSEKRKQLIRKGNERLKDINIESHFPSLIKRFIVTELNQMRMQS